MDIHLSTEKALMSAIKRSKNEIALLVGSPLSSDGNGIPTVNGVLTLIKDFLNLDQELFLDYKEEVLDKNLNDNEAYQKSFEFLADYTDQDVLNSIIRQAVLKSVTIDTNNIDLFDTKKLNELQRNKDIWYLPPGTEAISKLLIDHEIMTGPILTTNFDPLISIALDKLGYESNRIAFHGDGSLEPFHTNSMNIVYMHGFWINTDTMHTQSQLSLSRPKLKSSLSRVLRNKTLLVIGYGGWDDIFMQALRDIMEDDAANFDVIWAFYENDVHIINEKYKSLLNIVSPAIGRNRFRMYGGINCHDFLPKLHSYIIKDKIKKEPEVVDEITEEIVEKEKIPTFKNNEISIQPWNIIFDKAHQYIREIERSDCFYRLDKKNLLNLVCDWGLGKDEFIGTLVNDESSPIYQSIIYRIDFESIKSKSDLCEKIEFDFGFGLQDFISCLTAGNILLCIDNYDTNLNRQERDELLNVTTWLVNVLVEYNCSCKIIICSKSAIVNNIDCVKLSKLEEFDVRSYISNHSLIQIKPDEHVFDSLIELSQGIPALIDKYLGEMELFSIDEIYESHYSPETHKYDNDSDYPRELRKRVDDLSFNEETHYSRCYELLKTLSILEYGDSFSNIKKSNDSFIFRPSHLKELYSLELIETLDINDVFLTGKSTLGDEKIHFLPTIVRQYVYSKLTNEDIYEIVKRVAAVHLGKNWRSGGLNLCSLAKSLINNNSKSIGSTYVILIHLLRCSISLNSSSEINIALRICEAYGTYLTKNSMYREIIKFVEQIRCFSKESDKCNLPLSLEVFECRSLRMIHNYDKAKEILVPIYENLSGKISKKDKLSVLTNLCYLYHSLDDYVKANEVANQILEIDSNDVDAQYMFAITSEEVEINRLKELEFSFRKTKHITAADNLSKRLSDLETSFELKLKWLDKILKGNGYLYNKYRAITTKGILLIKNKVKLSFSKDDLDLLYNSYIYSFSQKMPFMFNNSHRILWEIHMEKGDYHVLFCLFQQSSLFWRVYDDEKLESLYGGKMMDVINGFLPSNFNLSDYQYVRFRVNQISRN